MDIVGIVLLIAGIVIGYVIALLVSRNKNTEANHEFTKQLAEAQSNNSMLTERSSNSEKQLQQLQSALNEIRAEYHSLNGNFEKEKTNNVHLLQRLQEQKAETEQLNQKFKTEFENLASKILEEKSEKFAQQNKTNLDIILNPLQTKIKEFQEQVANSYKTESAERNTLKGEIKGLMELNKRISDEANNLTKALKGDTKKQGDWGEVILERILEASGLEKGREYQLQYQSENDEGSKLRPDAVIFLPEDKHLIVDSKVSLIAYQQMVITQDDEERLLSAKAHLQSVRNHIKGLQEKNYQALKGIQSPDFVLMFMPIESAFIAAIQNDADLFAYAWDKKIVIVGPSTLLATLRTVSSVWKHEKQTKNAMEIAEQGAKIYDKLVSVLDSLKSVGKRINESKKDYDEAMGRLVDGKGNLIRSAEKLKELGVKPNKEIQSSWLERAQVDDKTEEVL